MHRHIRTLTVVSLVGLLAAASLPAQAKSRPKQHRGKKAIGEIVSFDSATSTLVVDLAGDDDFTGAVDPEVRVKIDHRGWAKKSGPHGNPTEGSVEDLLPGTPVLRMKVEDDLVTKIRIRPTGEESPLPPVENDDVEGDETADDSSAEDATDDEATEDQDDDSDDTEDGDDSDHDPDEGASDPQDALPPLPVLQP